MAFGTQFVVREEDLQFLVRQSFGQRVLVAVLEGFAVVRQFAAFGAHGVDRPCSSVLVGQQKGGACQSFVALMGPGPWGLIGIAEEQKWAVGEEGVSMNQHWMWLVGVLVVFASVALQILGFVG